MSLVQLRSAARCGYVQSDTGKLSHVVEDLDLVSPLRRAAARRRKAEENRQWAISELRDAARAAKAGGMPIAHIAREAGLSRQGVYDLLAEKG